MDENKVRLQHYVPRVYLKNFSNSKGNRNYIWVFDKKTDNIFQTNVKDIAFEEEFYDKIEEDQVTEKSLREIENKFDKAIKTLIDKKDMAGLSDDDFENLLDFIVVQMLRTKESRIEFEQAAQQFLDKYDKELSDKLRKEVHETLEKDSLRKMHKQLIGEKEIFKDIIRKMKWILIINKSIFPFWTSDNPVVKYNSINHFPCGNLGLTSLGIEIHFPINPKLKLLICDPISFQLEPNRKVTKDYRHIIRERDLQVRNSTRFIFSKDRNFDFAKTMLKENPILGDLNRKRVIVN